jgi:hypothetical protein
MKLHEKIVQESFFFMLIHIIEKQITHIIFFQTSPKIPLLS